MIFKLKKKILCSQISEFFVVYRLPLERRATEDFDLRLEDLAISSISISPNGPRRGRRLAGKRLCLNNIQSFFYSRFSFINFSSLLPFFHHLREKKSENVSTCKGSHKTC